MLAAFFYLRRQRHNKAVREDVEKLKQRLPLLDYLRQQNWTCRPSGHGSEFVGLCPLHTETRPSFYVNARKNLFYCHGCGQGGDLLRFVQLSRHLSLRQSLSVGESNAVFLRGVGGNAAPTAASNGTSGIRKRTFSGTQTSPTGFRFASPIRTQTAKNFFPTSIPAHFSTFTSSMAPLFEENSNCFAGDNVDLYWVPWNGRKLHFPTKVLPCVNGSRPINNQTFDSNESDLIRAETGDYFNNPPVTSQSSPTWGKATIRFKSGQQLFLYQRQLGTISEYDEHGNPLYVNLVQQYKSESRTLNGNSLTATDATQSTNQNGTGLRDGIPLSDTVVHLQPKRLSGSRDIPFRCLYPIPLLSKTTLTEPNGR